MAHRKYQFQFPTNGKDHSDEYLVGGVTNHLHACFNSLRTGRIIQTFHALFLLKTAKKVSIPYEREGSFRLPISGKVKKSTVTSFNSLRTGRIIQTLPRRQGQRNLQKFQFPTNGKDHSDLQSIPYLTTGSPFQFPTNGKDHSDNGVQMLFYNTDTGWSFNSLRTGRIIQTKNYATTSLVKRKGFQFPTNGKDHSDEGEENPAAEKEFESFKSLRTGRIIQTENFNLYYEQIEKFQFPTNGKDHSDDLERYFLSGRIQVSIPYEPEGSFRLTILGSSFLGGCKCFNSLRTGRIIQTEVILEWR